MFLRPLFISEPLLTRQWKNIPNTLQRNISDYSGCMNAKATLDRYRFQVLVDVKDLARDGLFVQANDQSLMIKYNEKPIINGNVKTERSIVKRYKLPRGCRASTISSTITKDGILKITAPRDDLKAEDLTIKDIVIKNIVICSELGYLPVLPKADATKMADWLKRNLNVVYKDVRHQS